ncbi:hypothetical protein HO173_007810 [Letharia columbiana]|uniref:Uncharacterized protein n=1 Tax=Letharia columbiana TaxID=112416 RepID=A0A8H6L3A0_9LECA|nr:uncharacterized protein HO173_007810 [Letharia columbiana]KAF6233980.1 hypothetical protein HO173_007810 [Letharia columbiana]
MNTFTLEEEPLQQVNAENIAETVISSSDTTGLLSTVSHQSTQPMQEKSLQQANAENTAEKPSGNKAPSTKHGSISNHHSTSGEHHCNLAYHPHCIEEQEEELQQANAENTAEKLSGNKATIVKNTAQLSKIPPHMLSTVPHQIITPERCIFGRIETVRCLALTAISLFERFHCGRR